MFVFVFLFTFNSLITNNHFTSIELELQTKTEPKIETGGAIMRPDFLGTAGEKKPKSAGSNAVALTGRSRPGGRGGHPAAVTAVAAGQRSQSATSRQLRGAS